jgi:leader peptidase (prepilin peptidase)/N-methyltransferase
VIDIPLPVILGVFGLLFGSFLNVCISRLPAGESVVTPRSRCPSCRTLIEWYDNIPVLSYLALGGKCRKCRTKISAMYPAVEIATSASFVTLAVVYGDQPGLLIARLVFTALLIVLFGTDLETQRLPNVLTYSGTIAGLVFSVFFPPYFVDSLIGAVLGAAVLLLVRAAWKLWKGVDAMGLGDVKMLAMIGAFLGWRQVPVVLFLASVAGAVIGLSLNLFRGRSMQSKLPFGTFLAIAAFVAALVGERLLAWYVGLYE